MFFITEDAKVVCLHERGIINNAPSQDWVTIASRRVLVENDPEGRSIDGCPNSGVGIKKCTSTLKVISGYSVLIRIGGKRLCLDTITGLTDGTPPGLVLYKVNAAGQPFVQEGS
jgi:hypothetical protein